MGSRFDQGATIAARREPVRADKQAPGRNDNEDMEGKVVSGFYQMKLSSIDFRA